jgi:hypothetical protein
MEHKQTYQISNEEIFFRISCLILGLLISIQYFIVGVK